MELAIIFALSLILVFIINIIGGLSQSEGYTPIGELYENVNYFGFNLIIRIFGPTVYILLLSIFLYRYLPNNVLILSIWYIVPLYYLLSFIIILFLGRHRFLEWRFILFYYTAGSLIAYLIQIHFISKGIEAILPDLVSIKSDLWLVIVLFLFGIIQNQGPNYERQEKMKNRYINNRYLEYQQKFSSELSLLEPVFKKILLSIMIYEDSNRPTQIRTIENLYHHLIKFFKINKKISTGIMQIKNYRLLSDSHSIKLAIKILFPVYNKFKKNEEYHLIHEIGKKYNGSEYSVEIYNIYCSITSK